MDQFHARYPFLRSARKAVSAAEVDLAAVIEHKQAVVYRAIARIETALADALRIVAALVPSYKETEQAHEEAADSHMFQARMAHVHGQIAEMRDALRSAAFDRVFELAEHDSLSLAATTMTGPAGWVYWQPRTIAVFNAVRALRKEGVPVYFSTDTGASVYVNTTAEYVDRVESAVADCGLETDVWEVGGPAEIRPESDALF